jgi:hypothetical protein
MEKNFQKQPDMEPPQRRSRRRWIALLATAFGVVLLSGVIAVVLLPSEPNYQGKSVSAWFEESSRTSMGSFMDTPSGLAFREMGGDALPYLEHWIVPKPTKFDEVMEWTRRFLPARADDLFAKPRSLARCQTAMQLVGDIGQQQRIREYRGGLPDPRSAADLVPNLRKVLREANDAQKTFAANALTFLGEWAAPATPDLVVQLKTCPNSSFGNYATALGAIGPEASEAAPVLAKIVGDSTRSSEARKYALEALTRMGPSAASNAVPCLVNVMLHSTNEAFRATAAHAISTMGWTPDEAVEPLTAMLGSTDSRTRAFAALALWNRNLADGRLRASVGKAIATDSKGWFLADLDILGTKARPLIDDVRRLTSNADAELKWRAERTLLAMEGKLP